MRARALPIADRGEEPSAHDPIARKTMAEVIALGRAGLDLRAGADNIYETADHRYQVFQRPNGWCAVHDRCRAFSLVGERRNLAGACSLVMALRAAS